MLRTIYRAAVPLRYRRRVHEMRREKVKRKMLLDLADGQHSPEIRERMAWLRQNPLEVFPYDFIKKYRAEDIEVFYDAPRRLQYVLWNGKKLYWKRGVSPERIAQCVNFLRIEQDTLSPHRYLRANWRPKSGAIVADLGAAEGNFSLDIVERARRVYLFECDPDWHEALQATFTPWKEKVEIVGKCVGNGNGCVALDAYFQDKALDYVKADIEGAEVAMLLGGKETFRRKVTQALVCTYHKFDDEQNIRSCLDVYGFRQEVSKGYMCYFYGGDFARAYFRHALLYGERQGNS